MDDPRRQLLDGLEENAARLAALALDHARIVAASQSSNADDEHDPEGATIAFEREQVSALLHQARRSREDLHGALARLDAGTYGVCQRCASPIGAARLEARPSVRTCITCASSGRS
jgi:DnaK suppressor protein